MNDKQVKRGALLLLVWSAVMLAIAAYQHRDAIINPDWPLTRMSKRLMVLTHSTDDSR